MATESFNLEYRLKNPNIFVSHEKVTRQIKCSCGFNGVLEKGKKNICPKCGTSEVITIKDYIHSTTNASRREFANIQEIKANADEFYMKILNMDIEIGDADEQVDPEFSVHFYTSEIKFYYAQSRNKEILKAEYYKAGNLMPWRKTTIEDLWGTRSYIPTYHNRVSNENNEYRVFRKLSQLDLMNRCDLDMYSDSIWGIYNFYKNGRYLLKVNYVNLSVRTISEIKEINNLIESIDEEMFSYINDGFLYGSYNHYHSLYGIKHFLSPKANNFDTMEELKSYYKNILNTSITYPTLTMSEVKDIISFKEKYEYTTDEIDELLLKIDNQAFYGINCRGKLGSILIAHDMFRVYKLPIEKTPKDLHIYCNKAEALKKLPNSTSVSFSRYNLSLSIYNVLKKEDIIEKMIIPKNFKLLDEFLMDKNVHNKYRGKLKIHMNNLAKVFDDYEVTIYSPQYRQNELLKLENTVTKEVFTDKKQIEEKILELVVNLNKKKQKKEVATNE